MPAAAEKYDLELNAIADAAAEARIVPFLGAGVNLCDRPENSRWEPGRSQFLPNGWELAEHLAEKYRYPSKDRDLARVCQFVVELNGMAPLYEHLRELFSIPCRVNSAHRFLASLPALFRARKFAEPNLLIVTTNYDDLVEAAFGEQKEELEVVSYVADDRQQKGKFVHHRINGERCLISKPNEYKDVSTGRCSVLLKIHGAIDRVLPANDSFVIAEDHYIDFLAKTDLSNLVPVMLAAKLRSSHFLFMGYSLRDWNLRVILQRIWDEQRLGYNSWAVQQSSDPVDRRFWSRRNVEILELNLIDFVDALDRRIQGLPSGGDL